ncbi:hypothetical protein PN499_00560 [Kamptonema animale CS-326]|uniref:hypothetical protein n=1 Tax=Kamptonema animale TaxID=92934 RepID=UPI002330ACC7|nr:hypothetical protein [Kamptonema animale]MDB9509696.1 hypothetical protein [Kamptonema animale CS-326]
MPETSEIHDRLRSLVHPDPSLQKLANGAVHSEGPVYFHEDDSIEINFSFQHGEPE